MPVSSPSYFPPSRGTDQIVGITAGRSQTGARVFLAGQSAGDFSTASDLIVIGDEAYSNSVTAAQGVGAVVIGSGAARHMKNFTTGTNAIGPVVIGYNAANAMTRGASSSIIIGNNAVPALTDGFNNLNSFADNVLIGTNIGKNYTGTVSGSMSENVIIGARAFEGTVINNWNNPQQSVIIGALACAHAPGGVAAQIRNVVIGYGAADKLSNGGSNVLIGNVIAANLQSGSGNVYIGEAVVTGSTGNNNIVLGQAATIGANANSNVMLGDSVGIDGNVTGTRNIILGARAGRGVSAAENDKCIFESYDGSTQRTCFYADMATGNVVLGKSAYSVNRDTPGTNILKLLNGTTTGTPVGGGFFYVVAGALHWVGSSGTDTVIAPA